MSAVAEPIDSRIAARPPQHVLAYYARQSPFSDPGRHAALLDGLPSDPAEVAKIVQGLVVYEHVAEPFYGVALAPERREESHIRRTEALISAILANDDHPLDVGRTPGKRLVGICRHFALLAVAIFRQGGVPARARVGFGGYFNPGKFEDHWVCEYWKAGEGRWALLDVQFDDVFRRRLGLAHDPLDTPRNQFLVAADAWRKCRQGALDPDAFGIEFSKLRGLWFVAGNLIGDLAALNGAELLPWDVWGAKPPPFPALSADQLAYFDALAALLAEPDVNFDALRARYKAESSLRAPETVFNALRRREERIVY
jgi:hypothetical protein